MKKGKEISGFDLALNYIGYQSRTIKEVQDYLLKKSFSENEVEEIIQKLIFYRYLNDHVYLMERVENNRTGKKYGALRLKEMLKRKGINEKALSEFESIFTETIEMECFMAQWELALKKYAHELPRKRRQKMTAFLQRRGFEFSMISEAFAKHSVSDLETDEPPQEEEEEVLEAYYRKYFRMQSRKGYGGRLLKQRIIRNLMTKGYSYDKIQEVINNHRNDFKEEDS